MATISIGTLAKAADVKVPTIRFYEQIGLLPPAPRTESDRRIYDEASVSGVQSNGESDDLNWQTVGPYFLMRSVICLWLCRQSFFALYRKG